jgi:Cu2+-containing amine oxidase
MEDLNLVEAVMRKDPKVIEQCEISGIPKEDMHKVFCDRKFCPEQLVSVANSSL